MAKNKNTVRYEVSTNQSLAASFNSPVTVITYLDNCAYQMNIRTTDSIGTFKIQGSLDYMENAIGDQAQEGSNNWVDLTLGGGTPFVNAVDDTIIIDMNQVPFKALRVVYTSTTAGTGHADIWFMAKEL